MKHWKKQGFTLIELLVALAISSVIISGITVTIFQIFSVNALASNRLSAVNQVQNAGYWISNDAEMARKITIGDDPATLDLVEFVTIEWTEWDDAKTHKSVYTLSDGIMKRYYYYNQSEVAVETFIAQDLNDSTNCALDSNGRRLVVTLSATVGEFRPVAVTRIYETIPRPSV